MAQNPALTPRLSDAADAARNISTGVRALAPDRTNPEIFLIEKERLADALLALARRLEAGA